MMLLEIYYAIQKNDKEKLYSILKHNIERVQYDRELCTGLLNWFVVKGHIEAIKFILKHGGDPNTQDEKLTSLLHWACYKGFDELVEVLLKAGAEVNIQDSHGSTPLHLACDLGKEKVVALLLSYGASSQIQDQNGVTPFDKAQGPVIVNLLLTYKNSKSEENLNQHLLEEVILSGKYRARQQVNSMWATSTLGRLDSGSIYKKTYQAG